MVGRAADGAAGCWLLSRREPKENEKKKGPGIGPPFGVSCPVYCSTIALALFWWALESSFWVDYPSSIVFSSRLPWPAHHPAEG